MGAHVGRAMTSDQVVGVNSGESGSASARRGVRRDGGLGTGGRRRVSRPLAGRPGVPRATRSRGSVGGEEDSRSGSSARTWKLLRGKAKRCARHVGDRRSRRRPRPAPAEEPTLEVEVDLAAAQRHGIKPGDVRRAAATLLSGVAVGSLFEEQKVFDVVVWGAPKIRSSLIDIRELLVDTPAGGHVRLGDVADVRVAPNPTVIRREAVSRYVDVAANVDGRTLGSAMRDVEGALRTVAFPLEYHPEVRAADRQPVGPADRNRDRRCDRNLPPAPSGVRQLARRSAHVLDLAGRSGGRCARRGGDRRHALVRLRYRSPRGVRYRGPQCGCC